MRSSNEDEMKERVFIEKTRGSLIKLLGAAEFRDERQERNQPKRP